MITATEIATNSLPQGLVPTVYVPMKDKLLTPVSVIDILSVQVHTLA
jgi:hypothetical protein